MLQLRALFPSLQVVYLIIHSSAEKGSTLTLTAKLRHLEAIDRQFGNLLRKGRWQQLRTCKTAPCLPGRIYRSQDPCSLYIVSLLLVVLGTTEFAVLAVTVPIATYIFSAFVWRLVFELLCNECLIIPARLANNEVLEVGVAQVVLAVRTQSLVLRQSCPQISILRPPDACTAIVPASNYVHGFLCYEATASRKQAKHQASHTLDSSGRPMVFTI